MYVKKEFRLDVSDIWLSRNKNNAKRIFLNSVKQFYVHSASGQYIDARLLSIVPSAHSDKRRLARNSNSLFESIVFAWIAGAMNLA